MPPVHPLPNGSVLVFPIAWAPLNTLEQLQAGALAGSRRLKLCCGLTSFPPEIFALAETLEILDLSGNVLSALPDDLPRLHKLRILFCSDNRFSELPSVLGRCPQLEMIGFKANQISAVPAAALPAKLRWLILTDNRIGELPAEIGRCTRLQKLMLAGNRLSTLPAEMAACTRLELLRISANRLDALPEWLFSLPRLAWLAFAGNPFCHGVAGIPQTADSIAWQHLHLEDCLGEGASGVIHRADWRRDDETLPVAVKLFKGALTSDGLPQHEMMACINAGAHPNLIPVLGKIAQHPENVDGLVMALIDSGFGSLAGPPSLASCTRDVYAESTCFSPQAAIRLALGIASAASHLHQKGILHGDLYAHNILHAEDGAALLGDFGAASMLDRSNRPQAEALERLEVRAFGCLLEELLERCSPSPEARHTLSDLQTRCTQECIAGRPLFAEIAATLAGLAN